MDRSADDQAINGSAAAAQIEVDSEESLVKGDMEICQKENCTVETACIDLDSSIQAERLGPYARDIEIKMGETECCRYEPFLVPSLHLLIHSFKYTR